MDMISKPFLASLAVSLVMGLSSIASAQQPTSGDLKKVTFLTNYTFHGRHSPFFVGVEKGFYADEGLDVTIQPATGSGFVVTALEGKQADYGMVDAGTLIQAVAKGANVKAFSVFMDVTTSGLASVEPYKTLEALKGANIAASLTDSARVILPIIFNEHGVDPNSVEWVAADPGGYVSLLLSGQIDLYAASLDGDIPMLRRIAGRQGKDVHFLPYSDWGYDVFGYVLAAHADRFAERPDEIRAFARATAKAVEYAMENPEETAKIMVKHNPTLNPEATLDQWKQSILAIRTDYVKQHGYGVATEDRVKRSIDLVKNAMKINSDVSPQDLFGMGIAKN
jgi:NitT/TauT family transport system substrate-binding protein